MATMISQGWVCRLIMTVPYASGETPGVIDVVLGPDPDHLITSEGEARRRQSTAQQVISEFQKKFKAPKGWAPLSGGTVVEEIFANIDAAPFTRKKV